MAEDRELLDRIAKISGQINIHRINPVPIQPSPAESSSPAQASRSAAAQHNPASAAWRSQRTAPYPSGRARGGRIVPGSHRHRSLVLNNKTNQPSDPATETDQKGAYVTKHDRHMQLINTSIYDRETQQRNKAIEETRKKTNSDKDQREKQKIQRHIRANVPRAANGIYQITINGLHFGVINDGAKLERIKGPSDPSRRTPKQADVGGVKFFRTSNGNLVRNGVVRANKNSRGVKKVSRPCAQFTSTGQCLKGPRCPYQHDPDKIAMCKEYLRNGTCHPQVDQCHLSHDPTPERVPACLHFLRGNCTNPLCRYAHVHVNPSAPVCRAFATVGFCGKGVECGERHVHECPDYTNIGLCRNKKCRLPHIDRADQMRRHAADNPGRTLPSAEDDDSDLLSDEDDDSDSHDVDSDELEELMGRTDASHALSQQQDFVQF